MHTTGEPAWKVRRGAGSRDEAEWKELPSPVLCSPSDYRGKGHDRWLGFKALEDS